MRILKILILIALLLGIGCNKQNVTLTLQKVINSQVYFKIENNKYEFIEVLIPKNRYLCYEGSPLIYENYFILSIIGSQSEQAYVPTYYSHIVPTIEELKLDDYEIIRIGINGEYEGKLKIPQEQDSACILRPIIERKIGLAIVMKNETDTIVYKSNLVEVKR